MKAQTVNRLLKGKHPKTLLEVFEEDDMPVVKGKPYPYTKKGKEAAAAAAKKSGAKKK
jgi:hypothetical protein